jgi:hypothetical protein
MTARIKHEWVSLLEDPMLSGQHLKDRALRGDACLRSALWRVYLLQLPTPNSSLLAIKESWMLSLARARSEWDQLAARFLTNPDGQAADSHQVGNPLSLEPDSPWSRWFSDVSSPVGVLLDANPSAQLEIRKEIQKVSFLSVS